MADLFLGGNRPNSLYVGATAAKKIYKNGAVVWEPWTPANLGADLALWLDAADTDTITLNGSNVSQWDDKSGNARHASQETATNQPAYLATGFNGKPTLQTDGNDTLELGVTSLGQNVGGITAAIVGVHPVVLGFLSNANELYITTPNDGNTRFALTSNPSASTAARYAVAARRLDWNAYQTASSSTNSISNSGNPWIRVGQQVYSSGVANHWTDGTQDLTNEPLQTAGFTSNTDSQRTSIFGGVNNLPDGSQLCEIVLTHSTMTTADRQKLEGYLAWKWGLVANLPSDHPYKLAPPSYKNPTPTYDTDAQAYFERVEAEDGQTLEPAVKTAINDFVVGCKADGIWDAIKAACILAGARTLSGALQPLVGAAPTNYNFIADDYNRKTGLKGNGVAKYLDSNRDNIADPQDSQHLSVFVTELRTTGSSYMGTGGSQSGASNLGTGFVRSRNAAENGLGSSGTLTGFVGISRGSSADFQARSGSTNTTFSRLSEPPLAGSVFVYARNINGPLLYSDPRLAFYSIGESLDLALLDARMSALMAAIDGAIA